LRDISASYNTGNARPPGAKVGSQPVVAAGLCASCVALFLCFLATVFGMGTEGGWFVLPPDYTGFGWTARLLGGVLGLVAFIYLALLHHKRQSQQRRRKRRRSYTGTLLRISQGISLACIIWEIALLAIALMIVVVLGYGLLADDGF